MCAMITATEAKNALMSATLIYSQAQVEAAVDEMAKAIEAKLDSDNPLLLCVMSGGLVVTAALMLRMPSVLTLDYIHATRYQNKTVGQQLDWVVKPRESLQNREVLIVDDILDEGITLSEIVKFCQTQGATRVLTAVLLDKKHNRKSGAIKADFNALTVADRYVFGYGMDYAGYLRNAPGIYAVKE